MSLYFALELLFIFFDVTSQENASCTPIVLWHGMGATSEDLKVYAKQIQETLNGVYILSLRIGVTERKDKFNSVSVHANEQVEIACERVTSDPQLHNGFNAIGFSQGAQFLRALIQRCPGIKVKNFISLGGQHQGVSSLPYCSFYFSSLGWLGDKICKIIKWKLQLVYNNLGEEWLFTLGSYWHDPQREAQYRQNNSFLADINNERHDNETYIQRLANLDNFVMVKYEEDTEIIPPETEWFEYYKPGQSESIIPLTNSRVYKRLGLDKMHVMEKLHFLSVQADHLGHDWKWFKENIVNKFLM